MKQKSQKKPWVMKAFLDQWLPTFSCIRIIWVCLCVYVCVCTVVSDLCNTMDCPPDFSVHGIFQARILEWVATSYSRGSSWPRDWICISCIFCIGMPGASVRNSAHGKGHEEGGLAYAKAWSSLRKPPVPEHLPPNQSLFYAFTYTSDFTGGSPP